MLLAWIILASWFVMAMTSPTKELRNRRLILISVMLIFMVVYRLAMHRGLW